MRQIFSERATHILRATIIALVALPVLAFGAVFALVRSPYATGEGRHIMQPVPFSHLHHVSDDGLDCRYCHQGVESSAVAGMPSTKVCMTCHSQIWTDAPVLEPVRRSAATGVPIAWNRVHRLPDYVYFDHSVHVRNGVGCTSCHGDIDRMPLTRKAAPMTMGWCLSCHRDPAPRLRPPDRIFATDWEPHRKGAASGAALMAHYGIEPKKLTDCTTCHR